MPHKLLPAAAVLAAAALLAGCAIAPPPAGPLHLRVIGFNDFHGNLETTNQTLTLPDPAKPDDGKSGPTLRGWALVENTRYSTPSPWWRRSVSTSPCGS